MTALREIRRSAELFDWSTSRIGFGESYLRGDRNVQVEYSREGSVLRAQCYRFFSLDNLQLLHQVFPGNANKKETVLSWLAA